MSARNIRVFIVDDQPHARKRLFIFLEEVDDLEWVGEAENGIIAVTLVERLQPQVVLMDLQMPIMGGLTATRILRQKFPHIQIIIVTSLVDAEVFQKTKAAGAYTCLSKDDTMDTLAETIRTAIG